MRVALAGLGTIGTATLRLLRANRDLLTKRGQALAVTSVSARDKDKERDCDLSGIEWIDDPRALAKRDVETVIETIGGSDGVALEIAEATLKSGKHLVTSNKALIAKHGVALARLAEKNRAQLLFEAAVCGGMPVVKLLREGLAANHISSIRGILNGTCNYILTRMGEEGMDFAAALAQAQKLGYAEADPATDIEGRDSADKLALLSALAFGIEPDLSAIFVEGIKHITPGDLTDAAARGGRIKLMGMTSRTPSGVIQRVQPVFVPLQEPLAQVNGVFNAVEITGDFVGPVFLQGAGAGGDATASAVVADLLDIARGHRGFAFGVSVDRLAGLTN